MDMIQSAFERCVFGGLQKIFFIRNFYRQHLYFPVGKVSHPTNEISENRLFREKYAFWRFNEFTSSDRVFSVPNQSLRPKILFGRLMRPKMNQKNLNKRFNRLQTLRKVESKFQSTKKQNSKFEQNFWKRTFFQKRNCTYFCSHRPKCVELAHK